MGNVGTVAIGELPGLHMINLRVAPATLQQAAVTETLGMDLPGKPGQLRVWSLSGGGEAHALCLAPDWWIIIGFQEAEQLLQQQVQKSNYQISVVDISSQRTTIELEGPKAHEVLAHLWDQDLRDKSFPIGSVSQGLMAMAPAIVCHIARFRYRVMVQCSFALHLWKSLADAAEEWV